MKVKESKYNSIALDIAYRIVNGELTINSKLSGRSKFASEYNVSPETIRKAVSLLKTAGVVDVTEKKGIMIKSVEMAELYIKKNDSIKSLSQLNSNINGLIKQKKEIEEQINKNLKQVIDSATKMKTQKDITPFELLIFCESWIVGKTLGKIDVWLNTHSTIIGIKRNEKLIIAPGPEEIVHANDILIFVCENKDVDRMFDFIYNI